MLARARVVVVPSLSLALQAACGVPAAPSDGVVAEEVAAVRGVPDRGLDPAIVAISTASGALCSGVLLASDLVLTALRCTREASPTTGCGDLSAAASPWSLGVFTETPGAGVVPASSATAVVAPVATSLCGADLALVALSQTISAPAPLLASPGGIALGARVRTVGFGSPTPGAVTPTAVLREHLLVVDVSPSEFAVAEAPCVTAPGAAALDESTGEVVGVLSRWGSSCSASGAFDVYTRADAFYDLEQAAIAWGPALARQGDGGVRDAGREHDAGHPKKPPTDVGAACVLASECAAGVCVSAQGGEYCSRACSAADSCPTGFKCVIAAGGGSVCSRP